MVSSFPQPYSRTYNRQDVIRSVLLVHDAINCEEDNCIHIRNLVEKFGLAEVCIGIDAHNATKHFSKPVSKPN